MVTSAMIYSSVALGIAVLCVWAARHRTQRWVTWSLAGAAAVLAIPAVTVLAWSAVVVSGDRSPRSVDLGTAVTYERIAFDEPRRQVLHVATVDFNSPCVELITTQPGPKGLVAAETGTDFVERTGVALSINVAFFFPFDEYPYWSSYPDAGDEVTAIGPVVVDGEWFGTVGNGNHLGLTAIDGRLSTGPIPDDADFAVRGRIALLQNGEAVAPHSDAYPRAVAGVDTDSNRLVLVVSDGKQPGYADGSSYQEIAEFLLERGVDEAVEFDGGGSATMAALVDGRVELLSRPSHQRIPGRQRPVATHLGVAVDDDCR